MKILFLATHLNTGGITSYLRTLAKGLILLGHEVHVATSGGSMEEEFLSFGAKILTLNIRTKSELSPKLYKALWPLRNYIQRRQINIIHAHTRVAQVMGTLLHRWMNKPYLSTCHGFFKTRLSRRAFPCWGQAVIAISEAVQEHLRKDWNVPSERVHLIKSGVDVEEFCCVPQDQRLLGRRQFHLGAADPVVGIISRLSDVKGIDLLITAMKKAVREIPEAKLVIFGQGKLEEALRALVDRLQLQNNVFFHSTVNKTAEVLPLMDVFVMPSRQEGLGLSIMEAQAAGVPVVATRVGGIPSLIEHGRTGLLVDPENTDQLAEAIVKVLRNREHAQQMGQEARAFILEGYSAQRMVKETLEIYQKLVRN